MRNCSRCEYFLAGAKKTADICNAFHTPGGRAAQDCPDYRPKPGPPLWKNLYQKIILRSVEYLLLAVMLCLLVVLMIWELFDPDPFDISEFID